MPWMCSSPRTRRRRRSWRRCWRRRRRSGCWRRCGPTRRWRGNRNRVGLSALLPQKPRLLRRIEPALAVLRSAPGIAEATGIRQSLSVVPDRHADLSALTTVLRGLILFVGHRGRYGGERGFTAGSTHEVSVAPGGTGRKPDPGRGGDRTGPGLSAGVGWPARSAP